MMHRPLVTFAALVLHVPHASGVVLDGDPDDSAWTAAPGPARTGPFETSAGAAACPYSDARLLWGDGQLYLVLYAADEDIRSGSSFRLAFTGSGPEAGTSTIEVSPTGAVTDAERAGGTRLEGAHVSREVDGTVDDSRDRDEEWLIEMAIPLSSLGLKGRAGESVGFSVRRCGPPVRQGTARPCAAWGGGGARIVLE